MIRVFLSSFLQIFGIAVQTKNIANSQYLYAFLTSLLIGATWIFNTNRVVKGTWGERIAYILGSATGVVVGTWLHDVLLR